MRRRYRVLGTFAALVALAIGSAAIAVSYNAPCTPAQSPPAGATLMRAFTYRCYGAPDVLRLEQIEKPAVEDDQVLVKVVAASVNPLDWRSMRGEPYLMRVPDGLGSPGDRRLGVDYSGVVEAVGRNVTRFKPGDAVFGGRNGALAEYITVRHDRAIVHKPANVTFAQAAGVGVAGITALQALRDRGRLQSGQKVLINGASGGVGTFAVQIAKSHGAEVTGVCSTRNLELVRSLGADHVIDYTQQDFVQSGERYDVILDNVGNRKLSEYRRVLKDDGRLVIVGAISTDPWLGPLWLPIKAAALAPFVDQELGMMISEFKQQDLETLARMMEAGKLKTVVDRQYPFEQTRTAVEYLETKHARAKVVVRIEGEGAQRAAL